MPAIVTPSTKRKQPASGWLTIGSLARATGIAPSTLRTWERRYRVPAPVRKASGHRLYPLEAVRHLRALRRALDLGRTPAEVMRLSVEALESLADEASLTAANAAPAAPSRGASSAAGEPAAAALSPNADPSVERLLDAARRCDRSELRRLLADAWARLGPAGSLELSMGPFLHAVGEAWAAGTLSVRHEHFASAVVADFLREARRPFEERAGGPWIAAATLEGDLHEIGLLGASLLASLHGWRVAYLGPDAPVEEIAAFARDAGVRSVAISVSRSRRRAAAPLLRRLRAALPRTIALWVGGAGSPGGLDGVVRFGDLTAFAERLRP
jgi:DNA-binding transcriptional MerR regulator/methylmalonyl-CoA mutase cobalamin-binding subunit